MSPQSQGNLLAVVAFLWLPLLAYSWWFYAVRLEAQRSVWSSKVSLVVLVTLTCAPFVLLLMISLAPRDDGPNAATYRFVDHWLYIVLRGLAAALPASFFTKGRLKATLAVATISLAIFWILATSD